MEAGTAAFPAIACRPARIADVPAINRLIAAFAARGLMLPRTTAELYEKVRDYVVAEAETGTLVGCAAVHIDTATIGELKALAVDSGVQKRGIGRVLVRGCLEEARALGLERLFCLTYQVDFFARMGFTRVDRSRLPEKVWSECVRCHRFLDCDEVAMWRTTEGDLP